MSEVNDICFALKVLAEKDTLPMFLATSKMIKETPILKSYPGDNDKEVNSRLKEIEKSINSILDQKNTETTTSTLTAKDVSDDDDNQACTNSGITWAADDDIILSINNSPSENESKEENEWIKVPEKHKKVGDKMTWKDRLNILRGTAVGDNETPLSADVHLVAYGLSKDTTGVQLSQWLNKNGLEVKSCDLTKFEGARSLTYKIVVKANDYDKAINPDIWPARVGVWKFKFFGRQNNRKGISRSNSQRYDSTAYMNSDAGMSLKPILKNSKGNMFARQSLQTVPGNLWLPANSPGNRKNVQNQMKSTVNGTLSQGIYQPRNVNYSNVDLYRNNPVQSSGVNNSFGCHNNYQASNGNAPVVRFSENLDMDYYV